jgi:uncharacterized membrane protein YhaH (DUF805 family)
MQPGRGVAFKGAYEMKYMFTPFARIADYRGRSGRREYWMFQLLKVLCGLLVSLGLLFSGAIANAPLFSGDVIAQIIGNVTVLVTLLAYLLLFLPAELALTVRRWHDIGNSGWTIAVIIIFGMIPLIGFIAWIVHFAAMCWPGDKGANQYGPPPSSVD